MTTYHERWGHDRTRALKGDPRIDERRDRADERRAAHVCGPACKRNRKASPDRVAVK